MILRTKTLACERCDDFACEWQMQVADKGQEDGAPEKTEIGDSHVR